MDLFKVLVCPLVVISKSRAVQKVSLGRFESFECLGTETNEPKKVLFLNVYRPPKPKNTNF